MEELSLKIRAALTASVLQEYADVPDQEGEIQALLSPEFEKRWETAMNRRRHPAGLALGKTVKIAAVAAALLLALAGGAWAVPAIRNSILGVRTQQTAIAALIPQNGGATASPAYADVLLDLQIPANGPEKIETAYIPMLPAKNWHSVPILSGSVPSEPTDTRYMWEDDLGNSLIFRQLAQPGYNGEYSIDSVNLGFQGEYTLEEITVSGLKLQAIIVPPSSFEKEGIAAEDSGRAVFYWSDGSYLFAMETNYDMKNELLGQIVESITETEDYTQYLSFLPENEISTSETSMEIVPVLPASIPEGWEKQYDAAQPNGEYVCCWNLTAESSMMSVIEYTQTKDPSSHARVIQDWTITAQPHTEECTEVDGINYRVFTSSWETQVLWQIGSDYFSLVSSGPNAENGQALLSMAASVPSDGLDQ